MIEIMVVITVLGAVLLVVHVNRRRKLKDYDYKITDSQTLTILNNMRENAVYTKRQLSVKSGTREFVFFPDGHIEERVTSED